MLVWFGGWCSIINGGISLPQKSLCVANIGQLYLQYDIYILSYVYPWTSVCLVQTNVFASFASSISHFCSLQTPMTCWCHAIFLVGTGWSLLYYIYNTYIYIYIPRPTVSFKFEGSCKKTGFQTQNPVLGSWWWLSMLWMHLDLNQHRCKPFCSQPGAHVHPNAAGLPSPSVVCDEMWKQGYLESFKAEISRILLSSTRLLIALGLTYCFYSIDWRIVVI